MTSALPSKRNTSLGGPESAFTCFATRIQGAPRKRAKFDAPGREKVKGVRKRSACLRCRILKIPCSLDDPCATCMTLALTVSSALEKKILRWSDCIRTSLTDVSIFTHALPCPEKWQAIMLQLGSTPVELAFADDVKWEVGAFTEGCAKWISDPEMMSISQVGAMSSPQFQDMIKPFVGDAVCKCFQGMVYTLSLAHTQQRTTEKHQYTVSELQRTGSLSGEHFLAFLEKSLKPHSLGKLSKNELQVLFLMLIGTILAVGYAQPVDEFPPFPAIEDADSNLNLSHTLHTVLQHHLCRTLAHYAIYLAVKLGLPIPSSKERFVLESAHRLWNKEGHFIWTTISKDQVENEDDKEIDTSSLTYDYSRIDVNKWAFHLSDYYSTGNHSSFQAQHNQPYHDFSNAPDPTGSPNVVIVDITATEYHRQEDVGSFGKADLFSPLFQPLEIAERILEPAMIGSIGYVGEAFTEPLVVWTCSGTGWSCSSGSVWDTHTFLLV